MSGRMEYCVVGAEYVDEKEEMMTLTVLKTVSRKVKVTLPTAQGKKMIQKRLVTLPLEETLNNVKS